jgi:hypothetical protein
MAQAPIDEPPSSAKTQVEITLKYDGRDVDDGTMPIEDVISALRGFSNAYGKIASVRDPEGQHQIRVSAINKSSFAVSIIAWVQQNQTLLAVGTPIAALIVTTIIKLIELKKATKGKPPTSITVDGNNNTVIVQSGDNTRLVVPREVYELYKSKRLDNELSKITSPLREGKIEAVSIITKSETGTLLEPVTITSSEKAFFQEEEVEVTTTSKPFEIDGHLVSLNKESNRGTFRMQSGRPVSYRLKAERPTDMYADFAYKGPVRVQCIATFDSGLELKSIEITAIERLQPELPFSSPSPDFEL